MLCHVCHVHVYTCTCTPYFMYMFFMTIINPLLLFITDFIMLCRCVSDEERHLSIGVISFIVRAFGSIPGPLITGALFDSACLLRHEQQQQCGLVGNCLVYDNRNIALRSLALIIAGFSVSTVFAFLVWLFYPKSKGKVAVDMHDPQKGYN